MNRNFSDQIMTAKNAEIGYLAQERPERDRDDNNIATNKTKIGSPAYRDHIVIPPGVPPYLFPGQPPPYFQTQRIEPSGITSGTLGVVSMALFWLTIMPGLYGTIFYIAILSMTILGIIFGAYSYTNRVRRNAPGLVGLILSLIAIVLSSVIWSFSHLDYYYYDRGYEIIWLCVRSLNC